MVFPWGEFVIEKFVHGGNVYAPSPSGTWLDFSANINPLGLAPAVRAAIAENIDGVVNYPDPEARELKAALAEHYQVPRERLVLGNGAAELFYLFLNTVRPKAVLVPVPSFSEYERSALAAGAKVEYFPLPLASGLSLDMAALAGEARRSGAEVVIVGNPNNPTGQLLETAELEGFLRATEDMAKPPWLLVDESFLDFRRDGEFYRARGLLETYGRLFIVQSLTKFYALPGLRLGFGIGSQELVRKLELSKDVWNVNYLAQKAGVAALRQQAYACETVKLVEEERRFVFEGLSKFKGIVPYPPTVNFLLLRLENMSSVDFAAAMRQQGILVRDCSNYPGLDECHVRVAVKNRQDNEKLLAAVAEVCS